MIPRCIDPLKQFFQYSYWTLDGLDKCQTFQSITAQREEFQYNDTEDRKCDPSLFQIEYYQCLQQSKLLSILLHELLIHENNA